ncbi:malonate decarboxylase holo-[acyl-carrier-protein] synthase [Acuticoccus sediminis]|uniref:malonate decarboxylase holo-[acyl-carrier-protein] synthase n=1 Tax=Acuticoccus sediminis TaxID=2184697 RepID=UPI001CFC6C1D|nr:malonate decarboxylase holo-[acyl-carrier-protein] synthase [Acuticoccus sediminis]
MPNRHDLLRIRPECWGAVLGRATVPADAPAAARIMIARWAARRWPVVTRRGETAQGGECVSVGVPLPPALGKLRLALEVRLGEIAEPLADVPLAAVTESAKAWFRPQLRAVCGLGARLGVAPSVFGALLWEHLTGCAYVHDGSDADLLWRIHDPRTVPALVEGLTAIERSGPVRLDGEIVLPSGDGVNWRELAEALSRPQVGVLAKSMRGVELRCVQQLFA